MDEDAQGQRQGNRHDQGQEDAREVEVNRPRVRHGAQREHADDRRKEGGEQGKDGGQAGGQSQIGPRHAREYGHDGRKRRGRQKNHRDGDFATQGEAPRRRHREHRDDDEVDD